MYCVKCGIQKNQGEYCSGCGELIALTCHVCGGIFAYDRKAKYCLHCGSEVKGKKSIKLQQYHTVINQIIDFTTKASKWVSYQELAKLLGLKNFFEVINPEDDKSTVGQIIYRGNIRELGFETITYKLQNSIGLVRTIRYIKRKNITAEEPDFNEVNSIIKEVYPDFGNFSIVDISKLG